MVTCLFSLNCLVWADPDVFLQPVLFTYAPGDTGIIEKALADYVRGLRCPVSDINYHLFPTINGKKIDIYFDRKRKGRDGWIIPCAVGSKNYEASLSPADLTIEVREKPSAETSLKPLPEEVAPEIRLYDFIDRHKFFHGTTSDGSLHVPAPFYVLSAAFSKLKDTFGPLEGRAFLDFGCGDLRAGLFAAYLEKMKVTAVEKDKNVSEKAGAVLSAALEEKFISADDFNFRGETDVLSAEIDWSRVDLSLFFYTEPVEYEGEDSFRVSIINKIKSMKSGGAMAMIFTHTQVALGLDEFPGLDTQWPKPEKIYDRGPGYYLQIYRAPKEASGTVAAAPQQTAIDLSFLPEEPDAGDARPESKITSYTAYIDELYRTIARFPAPPVYTTARNGKVVKYTWRNYCDVHGTATPTTVMIMTSNMWRSSKGLEEAAKDLSVIKRHYTALAARVGIFLSFADFDLSTLKMKLREKGTENDPIPYAGLSEYFLFKIFVDSPEAENNRAVFYEIARRMSSARTELERAINELGSSMPGLTEAALKAGEDTPREPQAAAGSGSPDSTAKKAENDVFGSGEFQSEHPLVKSGRILSAKDYGDIGGLNLVAFAQKMRKEKGVERVYFDLDLTVFRSMGYLSSSAWFENAIKEFGAERTLTWWGNFGHEARQIENGFFYRLMDPKIPAYIEALRTAGFEVIGLTARDFDKDQFRTKEILEHLGVRMDDVIFSSGASKKGEVLDAYETKKDGRSGAVPSLFVEDSFKNLGSVLAAREQMFGLHYKPLTADTEDRRSFRAYMVNAEKALDKGNAGHAFEYYFNAVVKILELKDLTRIDAYDALNIIHSKLLALKDRRPAGYDRLLQIVEIAKGGRSYLFHDDAARAMRPAPGTTNGPSGPRPALNMPILREGDGFSDEGALIDKFRSSSLKDISFTDNLAARLAAEPGMPSAETIARAIAIVYQYYRQHGIRGPNGKRIVDFYNIEIKKGLKVPARFNAENTTISFDIDLLKTRPEDLPAFLVFASGHEGKHIEGDDSVVIGTDIGRFNHWTARNREAVIRSLESFGADRHYVLTLLVEAAEYYRHRAGLPVHSRAKKRELYMEALALCDRVIGGEAPVDIMITASNCKGYVANEMARLAMRDIRDEQSRPVPGKERILRLYTEASDWIYTVSFPSFENVIQRSGRGRTKGLPRAYAGYSFGMSLFADLELEMSGAATDAGRFTRVQRALRLSDSALRFAVRGFRVDFENDHVISAITESLARISASLSSLPEPVTKKAAEARSHVIAGIVNNIDALDQLCGTHRVTDGLRSLVRSSKETILPQLDKSRKLIEACRSLPELFLAAASDNAYTPSEFEDYVRLVIEERHGDGTTRALLFSILEEWRAAGRYDEKDIAILRAIGSDRSVRTRDSKPIVRDAHRTDFSLSREEILKRIGSGRYSWLGVEISLTDDTAAGESLPAVPLSPRIAKDALADYGGEDGTGGRMAQLRSGCALVLPWLEENDKVILSRWLEQTEKSFDLFRGTFTALSEKRSIDQDGQKKLGALYNGTGRDQGFRRLFDITQDKLRLKTQEGPLKAISQLRTRISKCLSAITPVTDTIRSPELEAVRDQVLRMKDTAESLSSPSSSDYLSIEIYRRLTGEDKEGAEGEDGSLVDITTLETEVTRIADRFRAWSKFNTHLSEMEKTLSNAEFFSREADDVLADVRDAKEVLKKQFLSGPQVEIGSEGLEDRLNSLAARTAGWANDSAKASAIASMARSAIGNSVREMETLRTFTDASPQLKEAHAKTLRGARETLDDILIQLHSVSSLLELRMLEPGINKMVMEILSALPLFRSVKTARQLENAWPVFIFTMAFLFRERLLLAGLPQTRISDTTWHLLDMMELIIMSIIFSDVRTDNNKNWEKYIGDLQRYMNIVGLEKGAYPEMAEDAWVKAAAGELPALEVFDKYIMNGLWTLIDDDTFANEFKKRRELLEKSGKLGSFNFFSAKDLRGIYNAGGFTLLGAVGTDYLASPELPDVFAKAKRSFFEGVMAQAREFLTSIRKVAEQVEKARGAQGRKAAIQELSLEEMHDRLKKGMTDEILEQKWRDTEQVIRRLANKFTLVDLRSSLGNVFREKLNLGPDPLCPPNGSPWFIATLLRDKYALRAVTAEEIRTETKGGMKDGHLSPETVERDIGTLAFLGLVTVSASPESNETKYTAGEKLLSYWKNVDPILRGLGNRPSAKAKLTAKRQIGRILSADMQKVIDDPVFKNFEPGAIKETLEWLAQNRAKLGGHSMDFYVLALSIAGKLSKEADLEAWKRTASAFDLYLSNAALRKYRTMPFEETVKWLGKNRRKFGDVSLGYLMRALWIAGRLPEDASIKNWEFKAGAYDLLLKTPLLKDYEPRNLKSTLHWLIENKQRLGGQKLGYLMQALSTAGKLPAGANAKEWEMSASAYELYLRSPVLKKYRPMPLKPTLRWLSSHRKEIGEDIALAHLINALDMADKLPEDVDPESWIFAAGAYDMYLKNAVLREYRAMPMRKTLFWLYENRDRLGVNSFTYMLQGLDMADRLPPTPGFQTLAFHAGALERALSEKEVISGEINRIFKFSQPKRHYRTDYARLVEEFDSSLITNLRKPGKPLSLDYLKLILLYAYLTYGKNLILSSKTTPGVTPGVSSAGASPETPQAPPNAQEPPFSAERNIIPITGVKPKIKLIVLDWDGTIVDSLDSIRIAWATICARIYLGKGTDYTPTAEEVTKGLEYYKGLPARNAYDQMDKLLEKMRSLGFVHGYTVDAALREWQAVVISELEKRPKDRIILSDSLKFLKELKGRGFSGKVIQTSGSPASLINEMIGRLGLEGLFDEVYGAFPTDINDKPGTKAELIEMLAEREGISSGHIVLIGDGTGDVKEAKKAGAVSVSIVPPHPDADKRRIEAGADFLIKGSNGIDPRIIDRLGLVFTPKKASDDSTLPKAGKNTSPAPAPAKAAAPQNEIQRVVSKVPLLNYKPFITRADLSREAGVNLNSILTRMSSGWGITASVEPLYVLDGQDVAIVTLDGPYDKNVLENAMVLLREIIADWEKLLDGHRTAGYCALIDAQSGYFTKLREQHGTGEKTPKPDGSPWKIAYLLRETFSGQAVKEETLRLATAGSAPDGHLSLETVRRDIGTLSFFDLIETRRDEDGSRLYSIKGMSDAEWDTAGAILAALGDRPLKVMKDMARAELVKTLPRLYHDTADIGGAAAGKSGPSEIRTVGPVIDAIDKEIKKGQKVMVFVDGDPGTGKTSVIAAGIARGTSSTAVVSIDQFVREDGSADIPQLYGRIMSLRDRSKVIVLEGPNLQHFLSGLADIYLMGMSSDFVSDYMGWSTISVHSRAESEEKRQAFIERSSYSQTLLEDRLNCRHTMDLARGYDFIFTRSGEDAKDVHRIGKSAKISSIDPLYRSMTISGSGGTSTIALNSRGEMDIGALISSIKTMAGLEKRYREILLSVLSRLEKSPPLLFTFDTLVDDVFAFASPARDAIVMHRALADDPVALFHEIGEFLFYGCEMDMALNGRSLTFSINNEHYTIVLGDEAFAVASKGPDDPHYLLRAFQREVFKGRDRALTSLIQSGQDGVSALGPDSAEPEKIEIVPGNVKHGVKEFETLRKTLEASPRFSWGSAGEGLSANVKYDLTTQEFEIFPTDECLKTHPELKLLDTYAADDRVPNSGLFGVLRVDIIRTEGEPGLLIREVHPSIGYRMIKPRSRRIEAYGGWSSGAIEHLMALARQAGFEHFYASTGEEIKQAYIERLKVRILESNLKENYTEPFKGPWKTVSVLADNQPKVLWKWTGEEGRLPAAPSSITVLGRENGEPRMVALPVREASSLSFTERLAAAKSLERWLTFNNGAEAVHRGWISGYIESLAKGADEDLHDLYFVMNEEGNEVEGWAHLIIPGSRISVMEVAPWSRAATNGGRKYKGVGQELRAWGIIKLIDTFGSGLYGKKNISRVITLGHKDPNIPDEFDHATINRYVVEKFLKKQAEKRNALIRKYGLGTADKGPSPAAPQISGDASLTPASEKKKSQEQPGTSNVRDIRKARELTLNIKEALLSLAATKKVVLIFDRNIAACREGAPLSIFQMLSALKEDDTFKAILSNIEVITAEPVDIPSKIEKYSAQKNTEIFMFAVNDARPILRPAETKTHAAYIDEKDLPENSYYPLAEMVMLALEEYFNPYIPAGGIKTAFRIGNSDIKLSEINIDSIAPEGGVIIFKLLPDAEPCETQDLIKRYAELKRFLKAA